ncbi:CAP domain-containing protein [Conexibacter sp. SYSU D00693]|uniref:CAP domain-containing protein n=1 Tax=Conexibacter sp. SYSU D00693 TaxID=2812560 RepID=UPI00196ADAAC|nr:CAP domain-containing protein [Conexibacter sp. SYSU D00693]
MWVRGLFAVAAAGVTLALAQPAGAAPLTCVGADDSATSPRARDAVLCLVNRERRVARVPDLVVDGQLQAAAQGHAEDMVAKGYLGHGSAADPGGDRVRERLRAAGYDAEVWAEVIVAYRSTPRDVVSAWMRSATHCTDVLQRGVAQGGVGIAGSGGGSRWVLDLGRRAGATDPGGAADSTASCPRAPTPDSADVPAATPALGAPAPAPAGTQVVASAPDGTQTPIGGVPGVAPPVSFATDPLARFSSGTRLGLGVYAPAGAQLEVQARDAFGPVTVEAHPPVAIPQAPTGTVLHVIGVPVRTTVTVTASDGRTTATEQLRPDAQLRVTSARRIRGTARVRVAGRLTPALAGRRLVVQLRRGSRVKRAAVRTVEGGRFAVVLSRPGGIGTLTAKASIGTASELFLGASSHDVRVRPAPRG